MFGFYSQKRSLSSSGFYFTVSSADGNWSKCLKWLMTLKEPSSNCVWLELTTSAVFPSHSVVFPVQEILDLVTWALCLFRIHWCEGSM